MKCPICNHESLLSLSATCPSCSSNLAGVKLIDTLEEKYMDFAKSKLKSEGNHTYQIKELEAQLTRLKKWVIILGLLLLALPLLYYFFGPKEIKTSAPVVVQTDSLAIVKGIVEEHEIEIKALNRQLKAIEGTMDVREIKYKVKEGDLLYDLGLLFYNDTSAWYQIALDNKIYDIRGLPKGDTILIKYRE